MTAHPGFPSAAPDTVLDRIAAMKDEIAAAGDEAQRLRHLPTWLVDKLHGAGLMRVCMPTKYGGEALDPMRTVEAIEAVSAIDGSVGWNFMIGSETNALAAQCMPEPLASQVFGTAAPWPKQIFCGSAGPIGKAVLDGDGVRVTGQWGFASGSHQATWFFASTLQWDGDQPAKNEAGGPIVRTYMLSFDGEVEIVDTWDTSAIRGSGSNDVRATNARVPAERLGAMLGGPVLFDDAVFRFPQGAKIAYNKAGVGLGISRGALDAFVDFAANKKPMLFQQPLRERPIALFQYTEALATYRAARAFLMEELREAMCELEGSKTLSLERTASVRLACNHAAASTVRTLDLLVSASGTSAAKMDNPLERRARDAHAPQSHMFTAPALNEAVGRVLLGASVAPGAV